MIFIGTGALGPLGGFQTFLLAMVSVLMQIIFATWRHMFAKTLVRSLCCWKKPSTMETHNSNGPTQTTARVVLTLELF